MMCRRKVRSFSMYSLLSYLHQVVHIFVVPLVELSAHRLCVQYYSAIFFQSY
ncbi:hypothetical protein BDR04DRAFT_341899 [Suillus decipiens]|nr:hypothetical protein BDR04DRAFT_341899 [Suillus decipiens]